MNFLPKISIELQQGWKNKKYKKDCVKIKIKISLAHFSYSVCEISSSEISPGLHLEQLNVFCFFFKSPTIK